jgi:hypothetical protein
VPKGFACRYDDANNTFMISSVAQRGATPPLQRGVFLERRRLAAVSTATHAGAVAPCEICAECREVLLQPLPQYELREQCDASSLWRDTPTFEATCF